MYIYISEIFMQSPFIAALNYCIKYFVFALEVIIYTALSDSGFFAIILIVISLSGNIHISFSVESRMRSFLSFS